MTGREGRWVGREKERERVTRTGQQCNERRADTITGKIWKKIMKSLETVEESCEVGNKTGMLKKSSKKK